MLRVYSHPFEKDDGRTAEAINGLGRPQRLVIGLGCGTWGAMFVFVLTVGLSKPPDLQGAGAGWQCDFAAELKIPGGEAAMEQGLNVAEAARRRIGESAQDIIWRRDPSHFADRAGRRREVASNPDRKLDDGSQQSPRLA